MASPIRVLIGRSSRIPVVSNRRARHWEKNENTVPPPDPGRRGRRNTHPRDGQGLPPTRQRSQGHRTYRRNFTHAFAEVEDPGASKTLSPPRPLRASGTCLYGLLFLENGPVDSFVERSEEHTSELQSPC